MAFFRLSEWIKGYVEMEVWNDEEKWLLKKMVADKVSLWDIQQNQSSYSLHVLLPDLHLALEVARSMHFKLRFSEKKGLPFWLAHAQKLKVFLLGGVFFVLSLYMLSSFIWHVEISGTNEIEEVENSLKKLNIYPGSLLFRVMEQDDVQLALLEQLPKISWVGVKIQGTSVFVRIIPRIAPAEKKANHPQSIVAAVPGVVAAVLANNGKVMVKQGEYVPPGTVLISGALDNGQIVHADGNVEAIVWYRTELHLPLKRVDSQFTGQFVRHDYLVIGNFPILVWGFAHPPYPLSHTTSNDEALRIGPYPLPFTWRVSKVYEVHRITTSLTQQNAMAKGLRFATNEVLRMTPDGSKVIRQNILQHKLERGNLYMTVWSEVLQDIGKPQTLSGVKE